MALGGVMRIFRESRGSLDVIFGGVKEGRRLACCVGWSASDVGRGC